MNVLETCFDERLDLGQRRCLQRDPVLLDSLSFGFEQRIPLRVPERGEKRDDDGEPGGRVETCDSPRELAWIHGIVLVESNDERNSSGGAQGSEAPKNANRVTSAERVLERRDTDALEEQSARHVRRALGDAIGKRGSESALENSGCERGPFVELVGSQILRERLEVGCEQLRPEPLDEPIDEQGELCSGRARRSAPKIDRSSLGHRTERFAPRRDGHEKPPPAGRSAQASRHVGLSAPCFPVNEGGARPTIPGDRVEEASQRLRCLAMDRWHVARERRIIPCVLREAELERVRPSGDPLAEIVQRGHGVVSA
ncbi:MAG TPA: hypothetical protein VFF73_35070 [Planctomycetota bacterium]|nr:hypothetical protein [Planctomycetota bacterium]